MANFTLGLPLYDSTASTVDSTPPTVPTGLAVSSITTTSAVLSWTASTDTQSGVGGYNVYFGGTFYKTLKSTATTATLTGLDTGALYSVSLSAWDLTGPPGNESDPCASVDFTTATNPDTLAPTIPTGLQSTNVTASSVTLTWTASTDDLSGVDHYTVYDGITAVALNVTGTTTTIGGLAANSTHTYSVSATDVAGNESAKSTTIVVTTSATSSSFSQMGVVATGAVSTATSTLPLTATKAVGVGNSMVAVIACSGGTTGTSITDSKGNIWGTPDAEIANNAAAGGKLDVAILSCTVTTAVTVGTTFTITTPGQGGSATILGFTGLLSSPLDKTASNGTGTTSSLTTGATAATTAANEVAIAGFSLLATNTLTPASGWSLAGSAVSTGGTSQRYVAAAVQVLSATGAVTATGSQKLVSGGTLANNNYAAVVCTYKISATVGSPPASVSAPLLSGTAQQGSVLTTSNGTWTNSPTSYHYQWFRSPSTAISGATATTYTLTAADVGKTVFCQVTASNASGSTSANSNASATVTTSSNNVSNTLVPLNGAWLSVTSTASSGATGPTWAGTTQFDSQVLNGARKVDASYAYYVQGTSSHPAAAASYCNTAIAAGVIPIIGINPSGSGTFKTIASGSYDSQIIAWGNALAGVKGKVMVTWGHESDRYFKSGAAITAGCVATDFAAAWIHFWTIMAQQGATNCVRILDFASPTAKVSGNAGFYVDGMYAGKQWVDWICCDPYKAHGDQPSDTVLTTWTKVVGFLQQSTRAWAADGLPYGIIETGIDLATERTAFGESGGFIDSVCVSWFQGWPAAAKSLNLKMVTYFNLSKSGDIAYGYINNNTAVSNAFAAMAQNTYFNQPHTNTPTTPAPYLGITNPAPGSNNNSSAQTYLGVNQNPMGQVYLDPAQSWAGGMISNYYVNQVNPTNCKQAMVSVPILVGPTALTGGASAGQTTSPQAPDGSTAATTMTLAAVAAGTWDNLFGQVFATIASVRPDAFLRIGWEAYGTWYSWGGAANAANYLAAYKHLVTLARTKSAQFQFVWDGGAIPVTGTTWDMMANFWPGASYVDVIGADLYRITANSWASGSTDGAPFLAEALATARSKGVQVGISEIGVRNTDDTTWFSASLDWLTANSDVVAFMLYFNEGSSVLSGNPNTAALMLSKGGPIAAAALAQG